MVRVLIGAAIGAALGGLLGLLVQLRARTGQDRTAWAFVGSPGRGAIFGAVAGLFFGMYFGGPYGWRPEAQSNVVPLTAETFDAALNGRQPLVVVFYSESCPTCHSYAPNVEQLADEYEGRITVAKVSAETGGGLFERFGITLYPTTLYFANGTEAGQRTKGAVSTGGLRKRAEALLAEQVAPPEAPATATTPDQAGSGGPADERADERAVEPPVFPDDGESAPQ